MIAIMSGADFFGTQLANPAIHGLAAAPGSPAIGQLYHNTADTHTYIYDGTVWDRLDNYSNAELLTIILAIDGATSGIDADLVDGQHGVFYLARANHTGTQLAATISDFDTQVRTSRLDQMAAPTASVSLNSQKIINLLAGTAGTDGVNFAQLEQARQGIRSKAPVKAATTANINIANPGTSTFDDFVISSGDSLLVHEQTTGTEDGLYTFNGSGVALTRRDDADVFGEVDGGTETFVQNGTVYGGKLMRQLADITSFAGQNWQIIGAGFVYADGDGLTESPAGTFNVGATAGRISVSANAVDIDAAYIGQTSITTLGTIVVGVWNGTDIAVADGGTGASTASDARTNLGAAGTFAAQFGDGAAVSYVITHNLGTRDVSVSVYRNSTPWDRIYCDDERTTTNTVTLRFSNAPTTNQFRVVIQG